jgi:hypothetical protein
VITITVYTKQISPGIVEATAFGFTLTGNKAPLFMSRTGNCDKVVDKPKTTAEATQIAMSKACTRLVKSMHPSAPDLKESGGDQS